MIFQSTPPREGGDTAATCRALQGLWISIHTPAWGVTLRRHLLAVGLVDFNSHPRERGDSIPQPKVTARREHFTSHPRERGDGALRSKSERYGLFQFTPPRGG